MLSLSLLLYMYMHIPTYTFASDGWTFFISCSLSLIRVLYTHIPGWDGRYCSAENVNRELLLYVRRFSLLLLLLLRECV